ncbi:MAG TPA: hypothetical protein VNA23_01565 [Anaerolineales bacterium]|nr:hypothetical protein [Anaerolineales bacterium]
MLNNNRAIIIAGGGSLGISATLELRQRSWLVDVSAPGPNPHPLAAMTKIKPP